MDESKVTNSKVLKENLAPLFKLSKNVDQKLPIFKRELQRPCHSFVAGKHQLVVVKNEIEQIQKECKQTWKNLSAMNENFNEIENCFNSSLKVTEICVSLMEAKLALRGYEPLIVGLKNIESTNEVASAKITNVIEPVECAINDETYCIDPKVIVKPVKPPTVQKASTISKNGLFDVPESPKPPILEGVSSSKKRDIESPKLPEFSYSRPLCKPEAFKDSIDFPITANDGEKTAFNSFFPQIRSPVTPELKAGPSKAKFVRPFNSIPEQEEEEGGLVLHSRGSLLLQDYDQPVQDDFFNTPEMPINPMHSYKFQPNIKTPETPKLSQFQPLTTDALNKNANAAHSLSLQSPETPDSFLLRLPQNKDSPTIKMHQYDALSAHVKRLVSYKQANCALKNCYERTRIKNSRILTTAELEETIDLGGRTKCSILILQSLHVIKKIVGTDMYELFD